MDSLEVLAQKDCLPGKPGTPPLKGQSLRDLEKQLGHGWKVVDEHHLAKEFPFKDFKGALAFTNKVGEIAEAQDHHPDILLAWGKAGITLWSHSLGGLSESDFVLAAKIERIPA